MRFTEAMQKNNRNQIKRKPGGNRGFTLVEMVIVVAIMSILLGVIVPSTNSIPGFRVQRAANSITAALDRCKTEAMSRLVAEMKLERKADGYYISYYLYRGKTGNTVNVAEDQPEKIAPSGMQIRYTYGTADTEKVMGVGDSLILTYDRATGGFLPIQPEFLSTEAILTDLEAGKDVSLTRTGDYCTSITVGGGSHIRTIRMNTGAGTYTIEAS